MKESKWEPGGFRFDGSLICKDLIPFKDHLLVTHAAHSIGWICYRHADGHWVTLRRATDEEFQLI